jgi:hypothetical protein
MTIRHDLRVALRSVAVGLLCSPCLLHAQAQPSPPNQGSPQLRETLARLDEASSHFISAQATFKKDLYTALVKDHTLQDGSVYFLRVKSGTNAGIRIDGPGARIVEYKNGTVRDYNPGIKCFDTIPASGHQATIDSFLTLGFGGSGKDLARTWVINDLGPEKLMDGAREVKVEKLDLVPKDASVKANFTHITLWIDLERGISLKQVGFSPSGDTQTAVYSNIRLNDKKVETGPFEIKGKSCGK